MKNIPFQANLREIRELFRVFGELKFVRLPKKVDDEHHRGFGFVDFVSKNDAKVKFRICSIRIKTNQEFYFRMLLKHYVIVHICTVVV